MARLIQLTEGHTTRVSDGDFRLVSGYAWHAHRTPTGRLYARHKGSDGRSLLMHRLILGLAVDDRRTGDHKDGDGLNNLRSNLRIATMRQNIQAKRSRKHSSRYKGVTWRKRNRKWAASIEVGQRKSIWLGCFDSETAAARAYDRAAKRHFGGFACLNFPKKTGAHRIEGISPVIGARLLERGGNRPLRLPGQPL